MKILIKKEGKKILLEIWKKKYNVETTKELSEKMNINLGTLKDWLYEEKRYIPEKYIVKNSIDEKYILDKQEDNWGNVIGGKKTYKILIKKYGIEEIRRRQSIGGKKAIIKNRMKNMLPINIDLNNDLFLEFLGVLLGDGWLSKLKYKNKFTHLIGISGHKINDEDFHFYLKNNINYLFQRSPYMKEIPKNNARELLFSHVSLFEYLNKELEFPIGKKKNLKLNKQILDLGYNKIKHIIRGMFDTDGSFYFDKTPVGRPYPCLDITMKQPILMEQIYNQLISQGFKAYHNKSNIRADKITLKGSKQLKKWMLEIGSSNPYKRRMMEKALVAQLG